MYGGNFQSLVGVTEVLQGWIYGSEAVIVAFDEAEISLHTLIEIHLATHSCTSEHAMREKYRSAVYTNEQTEQAQEILRDLQKDYSEPMITKVLPLGEFRLNESQYLNYYHRDPQKPFCENVVRPKLQLLLERFGKYTRDGV